MTRLGVIGAGTMGGGIAQVGAQQGIDVVLCDVTDEFLANGVGRIRASLQRNVERGRISADEADATAGRISTTTDFAVMADVDCVIEAVIEDIETKRRVFRALDDIVKDGAVLATNTSSLSVTEIAAATRRPEWVVGMHFFNPVPAMALVEVARGHSTSEEAMEQAISVARELGKTPVRCEDTPGFIVNRIVRPFYNEALRILQERIASHDDIDRIMKGYGFRMGPFELMDLIGNDVNFAVTSSIYEGLFQEPRFRPSFLQQRLVQSGNLGQKTGLGWYDYSTGAASLAPAAGGSIEPGGDGGARPVTIVGSDAWAEELAGALSSVGREVRVVSPYLEPREDFAEELAEATKGVALALDVNRFSIYTDDLDDHLGAEGVIGCLTLTSSTSFRSSESEDPARICGFAYLPPLTATGVLEVSPGLRTSQKAVTVIEGLARALGKEPVVVGDAPGLVGPRIVALIVNEAAQALMEGVATAADIDAAVKLGANYPHGPLEWGDLIGLDTVSAIIEGLQEEYGEDRYRPSPLLNRMVYAGWTGNAAGHGFRTEG